MVCTCSGCSPLSFQFRTLLLNATMHVSVQINKGTYTLAKIHVMHGNARLFKYMTYHESRFFSWILFMML